MRPCQGRVTGSSPVTRSYNLDPEGHLAQLVERFVYIEDVGGPSPSVATLKISRCGEIGIHVRLRCVCRKVWGFKSLHRHNKRQVCL